MSAIARHLEGIFATVETGAHAVLLIDYANWHTTKKMLVPGNITLLPLPDRWPEMNPVEILRRFIRDTWFGNQIFPSYAEMLDHYRKAWNKVIVKPWRIMPIILH